MSTASNKDPGAISTGAEPSKREEQAVPLPLGSKTPWGRIGAITNQGGERYYMMSKSKGREVALMPADLVEDVVSGRSD